jgi:predicted nicotinamide N-methyase
MVIPESARRAVSDAQSSVDILEMIAGKTVLDTGVGAGLSEKVGTDWTDANA